MTNKVKQPREEGKVTLANIESRSIIDESKQSGRSILVVVVARID